VAPVVAATAVAPPPPVDAPTVRADSPAPVPSAPAAPTRPGPARATVSGAPTTSGFDRAVLERYALDFSRAIGRNQKYPRRAIQMGWQGKAELEVRVSPDGEIRGVKVAKSSGYQILDDEAVEMVKRTRQLPSVPEGFRGREFTVLVPVVFKLE
jgi:protein TonB